MVPGVVPILMPGMPNTGLPLGMPHPGILPKPDSVKTELERMEAKTELTGPRPVASIPVPGTPWSVVWSSDDRTFFFNATSHTSLWTTPEELLGNLNLQKILDNPPGGKSSIGKQGYNQCLVKGVGFILFCCDCCRRHWSTEG